MLQHGMLGTSQSKCFLPACALVPWVASSGQRSQGLTPTCTMTRSLRCDEVRSQWAFGPTPVLVPVLLSELATELAIELAPELVPELVAELVAELVPALIPTLTSALTPALAPAAREPRCVRCPIDRLPLRSRWSARSLRRIRTLS